MASILRKSPGPVSKTTCFCWPKFDIASILHPKCKDDIQTRVYEVNKEGYYFSKSKENFKKIPASIWRKVNKIEAQEKRWFLIKKRVYRKGGIV